MLSHEAAEVVARLRETATVVDRGALDRFHAFHSGRSTPPSAAELAEHFSAEYLAVSDEVGRFLGAMVRTSGARTVVEFGTSYGISTIYLADALRDTSGGQVISAELVSAKADAARANLAAAGLADHAEIREGDALTTLADIPGPIDLVLLDGWKNLYLPVLRLLEPRLRPGSVILADDVQLFENLVGPYLTHVRGPDYTSVALPLDDGMELSVRLP